jgi:hypothetical protein
MDDYRVYQELKLFVLDCSNRESEWWSRKSPTLCIIVNCVRLDSELVNISLLL